MMETKKKSRRNRFQINDFTSVDVEMWRLWIADRADLIHIHISIEKLFVSYFDIF